MRKILVFLTLIISTLVDICAEVKLSPLFSDGMILQRDTIVSIYGYSLPFREISISPSWSQPSITDADATGFWSADIRTPADGGPYVISIYDGDLVTISDILVGEVWICSGQSNMAMKLSGGGTQPVANSLLNIMHSLCLADKIRFLNVDNSVADALCRDLVSSGWEKCIPETVGNLSAVAYYFACHINKSLDVPVGLIVNAWGGSKIEAWMDSNVFGDVMEGESPYEETGNNRKPSGIFNAMVYPLTKYVAKGFLWYQGEANKQNPRLYEKQMPAMVKSWRNYWNNPEMPFYFVQIAPFGDNDSSGMTIPEFVETQVRLSEKIPFSGIVGTTDVGDENSLHPSAKDVVGFRLAHMALNDCYKHYGDFGVQSTGPVVKNIRKSNGVIFVEFNQLIASQDNYKGFEVIRKNGDVDTVCNLVLTKSGKALRLNVTDINSVIAVQYAYHNFCECNVKNVFGLPLFPFSKKL